VQSPQPLPGHEQSKVDVFALLGAFTSLMQPELAAAKTPSVNKMDIRMDFSLGLDCGLDTAP